MPYEFITEKGNVCDCGMNEYIICMTKQVGVAGSNTRLVFGRGLVQIPSRLSFVLIEVFCYFL
jgi:hypothetical protein